MTFLMYVACGNVAYELPGHIRIFAQANVKVNSYVDDATRSL